MTLFSGLTKYFSGLCIACVILLGCSVCADAETSAAELVNKTVAKIRNSGGLTAGFTMASADRQTSGTLKTLGAKFSIETKAVSTWYDGKTMWTFNPNTNETTVVTPTASELAETNPLLLITSRVRKFTAAYAKSQPAGMKAVVLTPKAKGTGFKSMHLTINPKTMLPVKLVAVPSSGSTITVSLSSVKAGQNHSPSIFTYPKTRYPKATIVDLR